METFKNKIYFGLIGAVCLALGAVLPYYKISFLGYSKGFSYIDYWQGKTILVLAIVSLLYILKEQIFKNNDSIKKLSHALVIILAIASSIIVFTSNEDLSLVKSFLKHGLGFYSFWLGVILLIVHGFFYRGNNNQSNN